MATPELHVAVCGCCETGHAPTPSETEPQLFESLAVGQQYRIVEKSQHSDREDVESATWSGVFQGVAWAGWVADPASWRPEFGVFLVRDHPASEGGPRLWSIWESDVESVESV